ncbi:MAG: class I SAM-dependent methyltransferase [Verrucomicrobiae bacterium]|nr:class I SAM-dependent methyltransferase [Verrucomicrobiae bacterium]
MLRVVHRLLERPAVYRGFVCAVMGDTYRRVVDTHVRPRRGERLLDMGCGTGDFIDYFEGVEYVGFDVNPDYVATARRRHGKKGAFLCGSVAERAWPFDAEFDIVTAMGVVHHLADDDAVCLFRLAARALKPGGRLITQDGCFVPGQPWLARKIVSMDRGRFVRGPDAYRRLAEEAFSEVATRVYHDLIRIPFTHLVMTASGPRRTEIDQRRVG